MFNSQKINNDPEPYVSSSGSRHANPGWMGSEYFSNRQERKEYDNNPNPFLIQFRKDRDFTRLEILEDQFPHERHARKVLEKLVNVYGQEEE